MSDRPTPAGAWRRFLVGSVALVLVAGACGNSDDDDAAATTADTATVDTEPVDTEPVDTAPATDEPTVTEPVETEPATVAPDTSAPAETTPATEPPDEVDLGEFQPIEGVPGVTDETIGLGMLGTGPANPLGYCLMECFQNGAQAYFDYINSLGGVHGRQLQFNQVLDDELLNNQVKSLELVEAGDVFAVFDAPLSFAGLGDLDAAGIPTYTTPAAFGEVNGRMSVFAAGGTQCTGCPRKQTVQAAVVAGATKVASLGFGVSAASKDCANNNVVTFEKWGPAVGIEVVYLNDDLPFGFPNGVGPEVTAMKEAGVDYITTCIDVTSALALEQELTRQGMDDVVVALPQGYGDTEFLVENAELLEGDVLAVLFRPFEADLSGSMTATFLEWMEAGGYQVTDNAMYGWMGADLLVQGLLAAGPQFDRASILAATNSLTAFTAGGIAPPVDWSRQHIAPTPDDPVTNGPAHDCMAMVVVRDGTAELTASPETPWFCFDPSIDEWQDAVEMNFE